MGTIQKDGAVHQAEKQQSVSHPPQINARTTRLRLGHHCRQFPSNPTKKIDFQQLHPRTDLNAQF
jgi:hypothetical protein